MPVWFMGLGMRRLRSASIFLRLAAGMRGGMSSRDLLGTAGTVNAASGSASISIWRRC